MNARDLRTTEPGARPHFALLPGTLAYLDTMSGLVPCRVTATHSADRCTVVVTAARPGYTRGEYVTDHTRTGRVIPRTAVFTRRGVLRVAGNPVICYPAPGADFTPEA